MNVDLPAPFGPVRPYRRPVVNVAVTSSKSTFDPYRMETLLTEIMNSKFYPLVRESSSSQRAKTSSSSAWMVSTRARAAWMASGGSE